MEPDTEHFNQGGPSGMSRRIIYMGIGVLFVIVVTLGYYLLHRTPSAEDVQAAAQKEVTQLVAAVGKLMILPDEKPIIATVADPSQLADQPFFQNAKKGDKVLIFNLARKAIMYRPDDNLIVDVAPLTVGSSASPAPKN